MAVARWNQILLESEITVVQICLPLKGNEQSLPATVVAQGKSKSVLCLTLPYPLILALKCSISAMEGILRASIARIPMRVANIEHLIANNKRLFQTSICGKKQLVVGGSANRNEQHPDT